jgi:hypothetical protein
MVQSGEASGHSDKACSMIKWSAGEEERQKQKQG